MNICAPQLGMSPTSTLGGEVYDRETLLRLARAGHTLHILLPNGKSHDHHKNFRFSSTWLHHIAPPHLYNLFLLPFALYLAAKNKIQLLRIHVPEFFGPSVWLFKKFFPKIPVVGHYQLDETGWLFNLINRFCLPAYDLIIADSVYLAKRLRKKFHLPTHRVQVIHCGTDTVNLKPGVKDPGLIKKWHLKDKKILLYLGLFIKRKNPQFVIRMLHRIKSKQPNTKLIMIGKGPEEATLKKLVHSLDLTDDVIFPGPQYGKEKLKYYQTADLFIFPSNNEGFVLSILEAMATGLPLLVPNTVSFPEAVTDGKNGYLLPPNKQSLWVQKCLKLLLNNRLRHTMSIQARQKAVKNFSWEKCTAMIASSYQQLIK